MSPSSKAQNGIIVPLDRLSPDALQRLIEEYVSRNGTDNGYTGPGLEKNVSRVMGQLRKGTSVVVYDAQSQTANIVAVEDLQG